MFRRWNLLVAISLALGVSPLTAQEKIAITIKGDKHDLKNVPVCVPLSLSVKDVVLPGAHVMLPTGETIPGQVTSPGLMTEAMPPTAKGLVRRDLHFVLPAIKSGASLNVLVKLHNTVPPDSYGYLWEDKGDQTVLLHSDLRSPAQRRPVMSYMHAPYDNSTPAKRDRTYKVFHHLYDPAGKRIVTNGGHTDPYTDAKKLLYPHHRGLMYAFNKISYDGGNQVDTWHAKPGDTHEQHEKILSQEAGPVLGRHRVIISWHGKANDVFAMEQRELTVYSVPGGTLVEFASQLKTADGKVRLDGDPQHAGFQFRASNEVSEKKIAAQTYYLRPDGKGELGATRNWEPKTRKGPVNLPWDAMSFVLGGQRYTVAYLNSPANPKESRFSERDYGRFGCYFEYDLTPEHPLLVNYRVWLQDGEMTGDQVRALYEEFTQAPRAVVKQ